MTVGFEGPNPFFGLYIQQMSLDRVREFTFVFTIPTANTGDYVRVEKYDMVVVSSSLQGFRQAAMTCLIAGVAFGVFVLVSLMLKMGERGMITYRGKPSGPGDIRAFFVTESFAGQVVDAVGSGDALLAYATLSMIATKNEVIASVLGAMAAAIECEHDGNIPVRPEDVFTQATTPGVVQALTIPSDFGRDDQSKPSLSFRNTDGRFPYHHHHRCIGTTRRETRRVARENYEEFVEIGFARSGVARPKCIARPRPADGRGA